MNGKRHVKDYLSGKALNHFLESQVGRPWNKVFHEICEFADSRSKAGHDIRKRIGYLVDDHCRLNADGDVVIERWYRDSLYVHPVTGILLHHKDELHKRKYEPPEKIHWYGDVWFEVITLERPAKECGCVHFHPPGDDKSVHKYYYRHVDYKDYVCIHGNKREYEKLWYVIEYGFHPDDEIYDATYYYYETATDRERTVYNLQKPGDSYSHIKYYRDYPEKQKYEKSKKSCNGKELRVLRELLNNHRKWHDK
jgi:hypothetical protein